MAKKRKFAISDNIKEGFNVYFNELCSKEYNYNASISFTIKDVHKTFKTWEKEKKNPDNKWSDDEEVQFLATVYIYANFITEQIDKDIESVSNKTTQKPINEILYDLIALTDELLYFKKLLSYDTYKIFRKFKRETTEKYFKLLNSEQESYDA